jgi:hypothetical protein
VTSVNICGGCRLLWLLKLLMIFSILSMEVIFIHFLMSDAGVVCACVNLAMADVSDRGVLGVRISVSKEEGE